MGFNSAFKGVKLDNVLLLKIYVYIVESQIIARDVKLGFFVAFVVYADFRSVGVDIS